MKRTADDDRYQLNLYVNPVIGDLPLGAITIESRSLAGCIAGTTD